VSRVEDELRRLFRRADTDYPWESPGCRDRLREILDRPVQTDDEKEQRALDWLKLMIENQPRDLEQAAKWVALDVSVSPGEWQGFIDASKTSKFDWVVCQKLFSILSEDAPRLLSDSPLLAWACDVICGKRKRPARGWSRHQFRDRAIAATVAYIRDLGHRKPTSSNPDGDGAACRLVADRLGYSYKNVERIWQYAARQPCVPRAARDV